MGDVINLRRARKRRDSASKAAIAQANRLSHGRSKAERAQAEAERLRAERTLAGAKLDGADDDKSAR